MTKYAFWSQENGPELTLEIALEAYPYILDVPDGTQRLLDEHNRLSGQSDLPFRLLRDRVD